MTHCRKSERRCPSYSTSPLHGGGTAATLLLLVVLMLLASGGKPCEAFTTTGITASWPLPGQWRHVFGIPPSDPARTVAGEPTPFARRRWWGDVGTGTTTTTTAAAATASPSHHPDPATDEESQSPAPLPPPMNQQQQPPPPRRTTPPRYPQVGDVVFYKDVDGGKQDGQVSVGKVSFIQRNVGQEKSGWTLDIMPLEDLGDGYYAEYPSSSRQRRLLGKSTWRDAHDVQTLSATFVRTEQAYKIHPYDKSLGRPVPKDDAKYDLDGYEGPFAGSGAIDASIVERDGLAYAQQKDRLLRAVALTGLAGTLVAGYSKGPEDAAIYAAGSLASLGYLLLLAVKTDTVATPGAKFGRGIANLRWTMPLAVLAGVALYDASRGADNPVQGAGLFDYVTAEQYGAAILGFLTYRIPLFGLQIMDSLKDGDDVAGGDGAAGAVRLPGSAGVALQLLDRAESRKSSGAATVSGGSATNNDDSLRTVLLVSGPQATGRSELVQTLIDEGGGRYVAPPRIDRIRSGPEFDRIERRDAFLNVDPTGRYGLTKEGLLRACQDSGPDSVVVLDADVDLAKAVTRIAGLRLVAVWVGLERVAEFEERLERGIADGSIAVPEDETAESVMRAKIREIVQEIEYGISSGIFEFTILNNDPAESLKQLREAAAYCFK